MWLSEAGKRCMQTEAQLEEVKMEMMEVEVRERTEMLEMALLASPQCGEFARCGWWGPKAWAGLLSGHASQAVPCLAAGTVSEPATQLAVQTQ